MRHVEDAAFLIGVRQASFFILWTCHGTEKNSNNLLSRIWGNN